MTGMADHKSIAQPELTIVVPAFNEEANVRPMYERVVAALEGAVDGFELVFVDDGSRDGTWRRIRAIADEDSRVLGVRFSRNFGHQCAVTAGVDAARGRAVVLIDGDLQDPPEVIPDLVARWRDGAEVVYARRISREGETWLKKFLAAGFYRVLHRITDVPIPVDTGDFRLMGPRAVSAIRQLPEHNRFIRGLTSWVGFEQAEVGYQRHARAAGETKYPLGAQLRFALDAITGFSRLPLRLPFTAGLWVCLLSVLALVGAVAARVAGMEFGLGIVDSRESRDRADRPSVHDDRHDRPVSRAHCRRGPRSAELHRRRTNRRHFIHTLIRRMFSRSTCSTYRIAPCPCSRRLL
jgi:glycosyltransferase involved in cell wall biosynthesis